MRIGVLTSSRADFGIYLPLLQRLRKDSYFEIEIIAFGTHLSNLHGYTVDSINESEFKRVHEVSSMLTNDNEVSIATAFGLTALKFADFWNIHRFDWVLCLGDRFEMAAAVQAGIPFGLKLAHIHGGETTLGAIDNIYRHQIALASSLHFPSAEAFATRIEELTGSSENIHTVGSLSIDELDRLPIPSEVDFRKEFQLNGEFALVTFHPETVLPKKNNAYAEEMYRALSELCGQTHLVITMPNADTYGTVFRKAISNLKKENPDNVTLIENFGRLNYFAAMRYCTLLIGNTSSGIIEAASFEKYVINVGDRQKGRAQSENVFNVPFNAIDIVEAFSTTAKKGNYGGNNIYHRPGTVDTIINVLKKQFVVDTSVTC